MPFTETVPCCGATRLQTLKAQLGALQNEGGADPANNPAYGDSWQQTLSKLARAQGVTFDNCCRTETRHQLEDLIEFGNPAIDPGPDIPPGALLDENGNPILDENGDYILIE